MRVWPLVICLALRVNLLWRFQILSGRRKVTKCLRRNELPVISRQVESSSNLQYYKQVDTLTQQNVSTCMCLVRPWAKKHGGIKIGTVFFPSVQSLSDLISTKVLFQLMPLLKPCAASQHLGSRFGQTFHFCCSLPRLTSNFRPPC